jgi:Putative adhesin
LFVNKVKKFKKDFVFIIVHPNLEKKFIDFCVYRKFFSEIMQFKHLLLNGNLARNIYRRYVSTVNVNVKSLTSIKVKSKDFYEKEDQIVKLTLLDAQQREVDVGSENSIELLSTKDAFKFKCSEPKAFSLILELPVESSPEIELDISADETTVHIEGLQTKSIKIDLKTGDVLLKNLKGDLIKAETDQGNISSKSLLLGKKIELDAENGVSCQKLLLFLHIYQLSIVFRTF